MSYNVFKRRWIGNVTDYDKVYGYQCVDLIKQWALDEYGIRPGAWGNAIDYARHPSDSFTKHFIRVDTPQQGDIVVFAGGTYGHIGLIDALSGSSVYTLEQNGSTGSGNGVGGNRIRLRWIPKSRVAAYYRNKSIQGDNMVNTVKAWYRKWLRREADAGGLAWHVKNTKDELSFANGALKELQNTIDAYKSKDASLTKALANEKAKPPKTVVKEVEKIVKVPVEVPVEVVRTVEKAYTWQSVIDWVIKQIKKIDLRKGQ